MRINPEFSRRLRSPLLKAFEALKIPSAAAFDSAKALKHWLKLARSEPAAVQQRTNRASTVDVDRFEEIAGPGAGWARTEYGQYYATSVSVYSAVKLRADALSRPDLRIHHRAADGTLLPVDPDHPAQRLLDRVNPWHTRGDLWRATEIYLNLWGSSFWPWNIMKTDSGRSGRCDRTGSACCPTDTSISAGSSTRGATVR